MMIMHNAQYELKPNFYYLYAYSVCVHAVGAQITIAKEENEEKEEE